MIAPTRLTLHVLLLACAVSLPACQVAGWLASVFDPLRPVDAVYKPPKNKTLLVFVDDKIHEVTYEPVKAEMANNINAELKQHKVVPAVIPYERILELASSAPNFNDLSVAEVGQKLGADIVLHVQIDEFRLKDDPGTPFWRGQLKVSVRLVDVTAGRLWPKDRLTGYPMPPIVILGKEDTSPAYGSEMAREMASQMAGKIAKLFYDHKASTQQSDQKRGTAQDF